MVQAPTRPSEDHRDENAIRVSAIKFGMNAPTWSRLQTRILNDPHIEHIDHTNGIRVLSAEIREGQICEINLRKSGIPDGSLVQLGCDFIYPCWLREMVFKVDYQNGDDIVTCLNMCKGRPEFMMVSQQ